MPQTGVTTPSKECRLPMNGDLTSSSVGALRQQFKELIAAGTRELTLDLRACMMADSSGIGLLVATHNSLNRLGGTLKLVGVSEDLTQLFHTMRLHQHFSIQN